MVARLSREDGLAILKSSAMANSNLGWRIVLGVDKPPFFRDAIAATADNQTPLLATIPDIYRNEVMAQVEAYEPQDEPEPVVEVANGDVHPVIKVTSYEGAKGLSAQHVYIAGLHDGDLPHNPSSIKDLEICKFIVGLTRTRKKCTLLRTRNFAGKWKSRSCFLGWISRKRLRYVKVDAAYWKTRDVGKTHG